MSGDLDAQTVQRVLEPILDRLSDEELQVLLVEIAAKRARSKTPADGLRFLLNLDAALYPVVGWMAVDYGGGEHTKHRHTRYHDFFVNRIRADERVLDIGCGIGALAQDIAERSGAFVTGIDLSPDHIATATKRYAHPKVTYILGDVLTMSLDERFETVVLSNVLEHLRDRPTFLRRVVETVNPRRFLLRVPVFERDWRVPLKAELGIDYRLDPTHHIEYTLESFAEEVAEAGLELRHQEVRWGEIWAEVVPAAIPHANAASDLPSTG